MAIRIGRLTKVGYAKRGAAPTDPVTAGTFIPPVQWVRFIPPWGWYPSIPLLESPSISGQRELPTKAVKGPATVSALKANQELEPSKACGQLMLAAFGQDTVTGDGLASAHAHNFDVLESAQLPTFDWWHTEGDKQFGFGGMMCGKWDLVGTKGEVIRQETEWTGINHVDGLALTPASSYSALRPLTFATVDAKLGGSLVTNLQTGHITLDNAVNADHVLRSDTNFPGRVWTESALATGTLEMFFEDSVEYNKFLAVSSPSLPTASSLEMTITSPETFVEGLLPATAFKHIALMGKFLYRTAEIQLPTGVVKMTATGVALPYTGTVGAGGNAYAFTDKQLVVQFINGDAVAY